MNCFLQMKFVYGNAVAANFVLHGIQFPTTVVASTALVCKVEAVAGARVAEAEVMRRRKLQSQFTSGPGVAPVPFKRLAVSFPVQTGMNWRQALRNAALSAQYRP